MFLGERMHAGAATQRVVEQRQILLVAIEQVVHRLMRSTVGEMRREQKSTKKPV
jgi:hypothetical protein